MDSREHATRLVHVLRQHFVDDPSPDVELNLRVAEQWLGLLDRGCSEVDARCLIEAADALPLVGTISLDLQLGVRHWARAQLSA